MSMTNLLGQTIANRYRVIEVRGEGGMATVYQADDLLLGRRVALKVLREPYAHDAAFLARFRQEAQAAAGFSHPNIVGIHDVVETNEIPTLILEEVDGPNLAEALRAFGPPPLLLAVAIGRQLSDALAEAHRRGFIHRDVKPENILFTRPLDSSGWAGLAWRDDEPLVKLTDFGIVRALGEASVSVAGQTMGTAHYLSPEQAQGQPATERSDLYALGVVLYELLSGRRPFTGETPLAVLRQHVDAPPPPLREAAPYVPLTLERVVMRALAKRPEDRFASASEIGQALRRIASVSGEPTTPLNPIAPGAGLGAEESSEDGAVPALAGSPSLSAATEAAPAGTRRRRLSTLLPLLAGVAAVALLLFLLLRGLFSGIGEPQNPTSATPTPASVGAQIPPASPTATASPTPVPATATASPTPQPTPNATATLVPATASPSPTPQPTPNATATLVPATATPTPAPATPTPPPPLPTPTASQGLPPAPAAPQAPPAPASDKDEKDDDDDKDNRGSGRGRGR